MSIYLLLKKYILKRGLAQWLGYRDPGLKPVAGT